MPSPDQSSDPQPLPLLERYKYPLFALLSLALLAGVVALLAQRPKPTTITIIPPEPTPIPSSTPIPSATPTPGPYTVYITGAVATPEALVTLEHGSRVIDALEAAGGARPGADLERVNLAQVLQDGDHIHVPTRAEDAEQATLVVRVVTATPGQYTVYVTGAVARPETLVALPSGSRVQDAIEAAGGATDDADLARVNLGQVLNDGDLVYVPSREGETVETPTPNHPPLIHINTATAEELEQLPGIGPSLASAIVAYREEHGPFRSLEELDNVPGIGPAKLEAMRDLVVVD